LRNFGTEKTANAQYYYGSGREARRLKDGWKAVFGWREGALGAPFRF
jgi:hypothetical protein